MIKYTRRFIILLTMVCATGAGCTHSTLNNEQAAWYASVNNLIRDEHSNNRFDGTIVIGNKDSILYQKAFGVADRNWNIPMTPDTRFDIASINKSFLAALILMAVEEHKLALSDKLIDYLPQPGFDPLITIHHLLTHTSGIPDYDVISPELHTNNFRDFKRYHFTNEAYAAFISEQTPVGPPGGQFHYSNFAYHLLPIILESIYNTSFPDLLEEKICKPYGLNNTFSETDNRAVHEKVAEGYNYDNSEGTYHRNNFIDLTLGRRIFSTSEDLYKWAALLSDGKILSSESYENMTTNHLTSIRKDLSYGYGFVIFDGGNYRIGNLDIDQEYIVHGGATEGYKAMLTNVNDGELIVAHLSNIGDRTNELELTKKIIAKILK